MRIPNIFLVILLATCCGTLLSPCRADVASLLRNYTTSDGSGERDTLAFSFIDYTSSTCRVLLSGLRIRTAVLLAEEAGLTPEQGRTLQAGDLEIEVNADLISLDARADDAPCSQGNLSLQLGFQAPVRDSTPYRLFKRQLSQTLQDSCIWYGIGPLRNCPSNPQAPVSNIDIQEMVIFASEETEAVVNMWGFVGVPSGKNERLIAGYLSTSALYVAVSLDLSKLSDTDIATIKRLSGEDYRFTNDFHCILADYTDLANDALQRGEEKRKQGQDGENDDGFEAEEPSTSDSGHSLSVGETVGIVGGALVLILAVFTVVALSRQRARRFRAAIAEVPPASAC